MMKAEISRGEFLCQLAVRRRERREERTALKYKQVLSYLANLEITDGTQAVQEAHRPVCTYCRLYISTRTTRWNEPAFGLQVGRLQEADGTEPDFWFLREEKSSERSRYVDFRDAGWFCVNDLVAYDVDMIAQRVKRSIMYEKLGGREDPVPVVLTIWSVGKQGRDNLERVRGVLSGQRVGGRLAIANRFSCGISRAGALIDLKFRAPLVKLVRQLEHIVRADSPIQANSAHVTSGSGSPEGRDGSPRGQGGSSEGRTTCSDDLFVGVFPHPKPLLPAGLLEDDENPACSFAQPRRGRSWKDGLEWLAGLDCDENGDVLSTKGGK